MIREFFVQTSRMTRLSRIYNLIRWWYITQLLYIEFNQNVAKINSVADLIPITFLAFHLAWNFLELPNEER